MLLEPNLKNMKKINLLIVCLLGLSSALYAQHPLSGKWYVNEVKAEQKIQKIDLAQHLLYVSDSGKYVLENFLGVAKQEGQVIMNENTLLFSDGEKGYFAVFRLLEMSSKTLRMSYLPYKKNSPILEISLLQLIDSTQNSATDSSLSNFGGVWIYEKDGQKLQMTLLQDGNDIFGTHCSGINCGNEYKMVGEVVGKTAKISLLDKDRKPLAQANLVMENAQIRWTITENRDKVQSLDSILLSKK